MSQTLQNQAQYAKSMNGIISVSDGFAVMENGVLSNLDTLHADNINLDVLNVNNINVANNIDTENLFVNTIDASYINLTQLNFNGTGTGSGTITFDTSLNIISNNGGDIYSGGGFALHGFAMDNVGGITMGALQPVNMTGGSITGVGDFSFGSGSELTFAGGLNIVSSDGTDITCNTGSFALSGFAMDNIAGLTMASLQPLNMSSGSITGIGDMDFNQYSVLTYDSGLTIENVNGGTIDIYGGGMRIYNKVAIGTNISSYELDVSGNVNLSGDLYKNGVIYAPTLDEVLTAGNVANTNINMNNYDITALHYLDFNSGDNRIRFQTTDLTIESLDGSEISGSGVVMSGFSLDQIGGLNMASSAELNMNTGFIENADTINFASSGTLYTPDQFFFTSINQTKIKSDNKVLIDAPILDFVQGQSTHIQNVNRITCENFDFRSLIYIGGTYTILANQTTFNMVLPLQGLYNILGTSPLTINLPDMNSILSAGDTCIVYFMRAFNSKVVTLQAFGSQQIRKMDNTISSTFVFDNPINNSIAFFVTKVSLTQSRWIQISPLESVDTGGIYTKNIFIEENTFNAPVDINSSVYTENLTFSNVSTDITITNWDASTPAVTPNTYNQLYVGTANYTGTGFTTSLVSGTNYSIYIQNGWTFPFYNTGNIPVLSNQTFILQVADSAVMRFTTTTYSLQAGSYVFGWYFQSQDTGAGGLPTFLMVYDASTNTQIGASSQVINSAPSFPNWVFTTHAFNLELATDVKFIFQNQPVSYVGGAYVCLTGLELTYSGAIFISDTTTGKDATIAGSLAILNNLSVNDGLTITTGGLDVVGGISTSTAYGQSNTTLNTDMGATSGASNSSLNVAIGSSALQSATDADRNVVIGANCNSFMTTGNNNVAIGYGVNMGNTERQSIVIGSGQWSKGSSVSNNIVIGYKTFPTYQGTARVNCIFIGTDSGGGARSNNFGAMSSDNSIAIGTTSLRNCIDLNNTAVGHETLYELVGTNNIEDPTDATQNNTALGYRAGYSPVIGNKLTFLGALADTTTNYLYNSTALGYNAILDSSNQIVLGGSDGGVYPKVLLPQKNYIYSCQNKTSNFSLAFGGEENVIITSNSVNAITLPTASTNNHIGTTFTFKKAYTGGLTNITITAGASQNIIENDATANTYSFTASKSFLKIVCIATSGNVWAVISTEGGSGGSTPTLSQVLASGNDMGVNNILANGFTISPTEVGYLDGLSSNIQTQLNNRVDTSTTQSVGGEKTFTGKTTFNNAIIPAYISLAITGTTSLTNTSYGSKTYLASSTASSTINLPSTLIDGGVLEIINNSSHSHTITGTTNIGGSYGSATTTMVLAIGQSFTIMSQAGAWRCIAVGGVPYSYILYNNAGQSVTLNTTTTMILNTNGTNIDSGTGAFALNTWAGARLTNASGVLTNNTGFTMTLQVLAKATSTLSTATKFIGILKNAGRWNAGGSPNWHTTPSNATNIHIANDIVILKNGESFNVSLFATATTTFGSATTTLANQVYITRLS